MKKLLCFISISFSVFGLAEQKPFDYENDSYFKYVVEKGDSLWSISRAYGVEINELVKANKISNHSSRLPKILIGETIFIPTGIDHIYPETYCVNSLTDTPIFLKNLNLEDTLKNCIEKIRQQTNISPLLEIDTKDEGFWQNYLNDSRYPHYFYSLASLALSNLCFLQEDESCWTSVLFQDKSFIGKKFNKYDEKEAEKAFIFALDIIMEGVTRGDYVNREFAYNIEESVGSMEFLKDGYFYDESALVFTINDRYKIGKTDTDAGDLALSYLGENREFFEWLYSYRYLKYENYEKFIDVDTSLLTTEEMAIYLDAMIDVTFNNNDKNYFKFKNDALDFFSVTKRSFVDYYSSLLAISLTYRELYEGRQEEAYKTGKLFLSNFDIDTMYDLWRALFENNSNNQIYYEDKLALATLLVLNHYGQKDLLEGDFDRFQEKLFEFQESLKANYKDIDIFNELMGITHKHMALYLSDIGEQCDLAAEMYGLSEDYFSKIDPKVETRYTNGEEDLHFETISLSICYRKLGEEEKAEKFFNLSSDLYSQSSTKQYLVYESIKELLINMNSDDPNLDRLKKSVENLFKNEILVSFEPREYLKVFTSLYIEFYESLDTAISSAHYHPLELIYLEQRLSKFKDLNHIKTESKEVDVKKIKIELEKNSKDIARLERALAASQNITEIEALENLYKSRGILYQSLFEEQENLKKLYSPDFQDLKTIINGLEENESILSFHLSDIKSYAIHIKRDVQIFRELETPQYSLLADLKKLNSSLQVNDEGITNFNFELANKIYLDIFKPLESSLNQTKTIYLFGSELENLPFNALVSKLKDTNSELEKLIESEFLIDNYNFVNLYPLSNEKVARYDYKFIGFSNPSNLPKIGLASLPSTEEESRFIEMASGSRNQSFTGPMASKENVKQISNNSFERIHFGTHAVPPYWNNITSESSLILDSEDGDFLLSASEISSFDLETDMVILSSCNSSNDGFDQLYKAFLVAGSNSVVFSNWSLETKSSQLLNKELFNLLWADEKLEKHEALREALLKMKNSYENPKFISPSYWANFSIAYSSI